MRFRNQRQLRPFGRRPAVIFDEVEEVSDLRFVALAWLGGLVFTLAMIA
jgi:hypothetical protein